MPLALKFQEDYSTEQHHCSENYYGGDLRVAVNLFTYKASNTTIAKVNNNTIVIDSRDKRTLKVSDICTAIMKDHSNPTKIRSN